MEEKFYNIDEQRRWDEDYMWEKEGHEWSKIFGGTENLWNKEIFPYIKEFRNKHFSAFECIYAFVNAYTKKYFFG